MLDYSSLNTAQLSAMKDTEGAVLVLAGAGSGKTRVLTHRVAYLIAERNVSPYNILAITFTNKATEEMRERIATLTGTEMGFNGGFGGSNSVWVSTFHSLGASVLRMHGEKIGLNSNFTIYDESESERMIKKASRFLGIDNDAVIESAKNYIDKAKDKCVSPEEFLVDFKGTLERANEISRIYTAYEKLMLESNATDYGDLLYKTYQLFLKHPEVLDKYQSRFKYIHVDEFQDTNKVQYKLVKMLAGKHGNIFAVGDDDQSIYGWRGAVIQNILNFDKDFAGTKMHKLEENYRSTPEILACANNVIKNNGARHEKTLFTKRGSGVKVSFNYSYNDYQEAEFVAREVENLMRFNGYRGKDFAILIRNNSLSRLFESALRGIRVNYRVVGGFKFFERKEVQDVLAYMRLASNMKDTSAVERVINFPRRGIGDKCVSDMSEYALRNSLNIMNVILNINDIGELKSTAKKVNDFKEIVEDLVKNKNLPLPEFVDFVIARAGFEEYYQSTGKEEDLSRCDNINELSRIVGELCKQDPYMNLDSFLQSATLAPDASETTSSADMVTIATIHSAKGLEWRVVFVVCCEEDLFPSSRAKNSGEIEEERRLMYVATTRARERLYISHAGSRFSYAFRCVTASLPSRFIAEAKKEISEARGENLIQNSELRIKNYGSFNLKPIATAQKPQPDTKVYNSSMSGFVQGASVNHPSYGNGKIVLVLGQGDMAIATVMFDGDAGVKKFIIKNAPLTLI
ncbi:MAG: UvrD-helicase domain-containing protein [Firmicutes bacterium]|nr:UvrD-helicase domain-containing protein [Bacillota bacterium]